MTNYENLVMATQEIYYRYYGTYQRGSTPYVLSKKRPGPLDQEVKQFADMVRAADHIVIGGASGLSAAGGGDFYYEDNASFRHYFGKFAEKYHLHGAFSGMFYQWKTPEEKWGYIATFLHTTLTAPIRRPYLDLRAIVGDKDYFFLTTNQDTQAIKAFPEDHVAQIQGDHRFFQCSRCCTDELWDAVEPVERMVEAMGDGTSVPTELIPHCPHCGAEMFPWVRGYGNLLEGERYQEQYRKVSDYVDRMAHENVLYLELGVGRLTPMFIQEPFWHLVAANPNARYVAVNNKTRFLPKDIEDQGIAIKGDIAEVLDGVCRELGASVPSADAVVA